jgi:hypothetical protein
MSFTLQPASEADAHRVAELEAAAYEPNPFNRILFPGPFPDDARERRVAELAKDLRGDASTRWLKVADMELPQGKQTIAFAKWQLYNMDPRSPPVSSQPSPGCNAEACEVLFGGIAKQRARLVGDRPCVCEFGVPAARNGVEC